MNIASLSKGIAVGMVAGAATYALSNCTRAQKRKMKSSTMKAIRSVSDMVSGIGEMF